MPPPPLPLVSCMCLGWGLAPPCVLAIIYPPQHPSRLVPHPLHKHRQPGLTPSSCPASEAWLGQRWQRVLGLSCCLLRQGAWAARGPAARPGASLGPEPSSLAVNEELRGGSAILGGGTPGAQVGQGHTRSVGGGTGTSLEPGAEPRQWAEEELSLRASGGGGFSADPEEGVGKATTTEAQKSGAGWQTGARRGPQHCGQDGTGWDHPRQGTWGRARTALGR